MIIAAFLVYNEVEKICFFEKNFLLADIYMNVALEMFFFTLGNANIYFTNRKLYWRFYMTTKVLLTSHCVQLINWKEFPLIALGKNNKAFIMPMTSLAIGSKMSIYLF